MLNSSWNRHAHPRLMLWLPSSICNVFRVFHPDACSCFGYGGRGLPCGGQLSPQHAFAPGDLRDAASFKETIEARMAEFTDPSRSKDLFSPSGFNGDAFSTDSFWGQVTKYFNAVCLPECQVSDWNGTDARSYTYTPPPDSSLHGHCCGRPYQPKLRTLTNDPSPRIAVEGS